MRRAALVALVVLTGCQRSSGPAAPIRLFHTFGPEETAALNAALVDAEREVGRRVAPTLVPFGRAQNRLRDTLGRGGAACPDLARIDATWLPGLAAAGLLQAPPEPLLETFTAESIELTEWAGRRWGLPQAIDGLALLYDAAAVRAAGGTWPPATLDELEAAARRLSRPGRFGLSVRSDGYWFVAFLRAAGADVLDPTSGALGVDQPEAAGALARYAALASPGGVAPPIEVGDEAARELRRFVAGELAILVAGPWTVAGLSRLPDLVLAEPGGCPVARSQRRCLELGVAPYPRAPDGRAAAPRGGQVYVVPRCAGHPADAWRLAVHLTRPELQADWSLRLGVMPTRQAARAHASALSRGFADALAATRPLPRDPITPELFDDLTPAVQAALAGDATPAEALAGVARAWERLLRPHDGRRP